MAEPQPRQTTSAFDLVPRSFELVSKNLPLFALVSSAPLLMTVLSAVNSKEVEVGSSLSPGLLFQSALGMAPAVALILGIISLVLQTMALGLVLKAAQDKTANLNELTETARKFTLKYLGLSILSGLVIVLGFVLLIVPGFIAITRLFLAPYVMVSENLGVVESMKRSSELSKGNAGAIWGVIGVTILLGIIGQILGFISPVVGAVVASLLGIGYSVAPAIRYLELKGK
ncbi:hypothetical protein EKI60_05420 [Candidatus Saccharibacteria bacterium]|nr:MAG: hypothetical protein EKI60_05420 [Candidatus Saccharibacteria bacterium]